MFDDPEELSLAVPRRLYGKLRGGWIEGSPQDARASARYSMASGAHYGVDFASRNQILVSRDHDYLELHTAWHRWAAAWGVHPLPEHAGILIIDNHWDAQTAAHEILICLGQHAPLTNRLYQYDTRRGWQRGKP